VSVPVVAITGNHLRHRWWAAQLAAAPDLDLRGVVSEAKRASRQEARPDQPALVQAHFAARAEAERRHFGAAPAWEELGVSVREVELGAANSEETFAWVTEREPTHLLLLGCSIVREPLLAQFPRETVNTHLGLSPYYRGTATNFWPLERGEPECVGATIHLATARVDAGAILRQLRPQLAAEDSLHDIGCRALAAAATALPSTVAAYARGEREPVAQQAGGLLFKGADFGEEPLARALARLDAGMIPAYLADKAARDAAFPIVE
jgi:folate-dependent phosphoribosylglycinamide formyltransferase PurN